MVERPNRGQESSVEDNARTRRSDSMMGSVQRGHRECRSVSTKIVMLCMLSLCLMAMSASAQHGISEEEMEFWDDCRMQYGKLAVYDAVNHQCLCSKDAYFDGNRCMRNPPQGGLGSDLEDPRFSQGMVRGGGMQHGGDRQFGLHGSGMTKFAGAPGTDLDFPMGGARVGLDVLEEQNMQLSSRVQEYQDKIEHLTHAVKMERMKSEGMLKEADMSLKKTQNEVQRLAKEKEDLAKRLNQLVSGGGGMSLGGTKGGQSDEEMEKLRQYNEQLAAQTKILERKSNTTNIRLQSLQEKLDEQRVKEQEMMREIRELRKLAGANPEKMAGASAAAGQGMSATTQKDRKCQEKYGANAVYEPTKKMCVCRQGYVVKNKECVPDPSQKPPARVTAEPEEDEGEFCSIDGPSSSGSCSVGGGGAGGGKAAGGAGAKGGMGLGRGDDGGNMQMNKQSGRMTLDRQQEAEEPRMRRTPPSEAEEPLIQRTPPSSKSKKQAAKGGAEEEYQMYDRECKKMYGPHSKFDGTESCECEEGYKVKSGRCVEGGAAASRDRETPEAAQSSGAKGAEADIVDISDDGLDPAYVEELRKMFDMYDMDRNGFISYKENVLMDKQLHGDEYNEEQALQSFNEFDATGDSRVSWAEFKSGVLKQQMGMEQQIHMYNQQCKEAHGAYAVFDGVEACVCEEGYTIGEGDQCVPERARGSGLGGLGGRGGGLGGRAGGGGGMGGLEDLLDKGGKGS